MRTWMRASFLSFLLAASSLAADPALLRLVMPDARMLLGMNIERAKATPLGRFVLSQVETTDAGLQKFISETGVDPRSDLHEFLIASRANPRENKALILVKGFFNTAKILTLSRKNGALVQNYKGVAILTGKQKDSQWMAGVPKGKTSPGLALLSNSILVFGDIASVREAIDRRATGASLSPRLAARVRELSNLYHFWGVSMIPVSEWSSKVPDEKLSGAMQGDVLRSVAETSGGVRFGSDIEITGEAVTRSEKDATALADVIRFLIGLVQLNQKDAKITAAASILQKLKLSTEGNTMRLSMRIPEADVEKFVETAKAQMKQARARQTQARKQPAARPASPPPAAGGLTIHSSEMGTVEIKPQP